MLKILEILDIFCHLFPKNVKILALAEAFEKILTFIFSFGSLNLDCKFQLLNHLSAMTLEKK